MEKINELMKKYDINACSVTIVKNYEVSLSEGFGKNIDTETKFMAGSVSKPVFALGVMLLNGSKKINIDKDVNEYLTSWKVPSERNFVPKITLRQLLSHTAGTTTHGFTGYNRKDKIPTIIQILNGEKPSNSDKVVVDTIPGTTIKYSGGGTTIAQLTICDKLKKDFPDIMDELLFKKMDLSCSYQQPIGKYKLTNYAKGYTDEGKVKGDYHIYPEMAAAGLWTNSLDLAKIGIEICKGFHNKSDIFDKKMIKQILTPTYKYSDGKRGRGIGFSLKEDNFFHVGLDEGYISDFNFNKNGNGFVIMINNSSENAFKFIRDLKDIIYDILNWDNENKIIPTLGLEKYEGKYYDKLNNLKENITSSVITGELALIRSIFNIWNAYALFLT